MRILVTGASGFIGSTLAEYLTTETDHTVWSVDRSAPSSAVAPFTVLDLRMRAKVVSLFVKFDPDCVVHLAGRTDVWEANAHEVWLADNVMATMNVNEAARAVGCKRIIYASSSAADNQPLSLYGASKRATEIFAGTMAHLDGSLDIVGLRFHSVYGTGSNGGFIKKAIHALDTGVVHFNTWRHEDGSRLYPGRDWTHIDDVVEAIERVIDTPHPFGLGGHVVCDVGTGQQLTTRYVVDILKILSHCDIAVEQYFDLPATDVKFAVADTRSMSHLFDWNASIGLEDGLKSCLEAE